MAVDSDASSNWKLDLSDDAVRWKEETLAAYNKNVEQLRAVGQAKPDMVTFRELREKYTPADMHGHIPGIKPGDKFNGRGELAILGLHKKILNGIDSKNDETRGAFAIVMSGGYKDDDDEGTTFWYTGQGGQAKGQQVKDQIWASGNLALRQSFESKTPVRVFRGIMENGARMYAYDGLYFVKEVKMEPSKDGPLICKFLMVGLSNQSQASAKVEFGALGGVVKGLTGRRQLAAQEVVHRNKKAAIANTLDGWDIVKNVRLQALSLRKGLLVMDLSQGREKVPIPMFNETDNGIGPPEDVHYISDYVFGPGQEELVKDILEEQTEIYLQGYMKGERCALEFNRMMVERDESLEDKYEPYKRTFIDNYNPSGLLLSTDSFGVIECGEGCGKKCKNNRRVAQGIQLPLEVFMTENKGWGVRCDAAISGGEYVCSYIGEVITEAVADSRCSNDQYLFELNHFASIFEDLDQLGREAMLDEVPDYKIPPCPERNLNARVAQKAAALKQQQKEKEGASKAAEALAAANSGRAKPARKASKVHAVEQAGASGARDASPPIVSNSSSPSCEHAEKNCLIISSDAATTSGQPKASGEQNKSSSPAAIEARAAVRVREDEHGVSSTPVDGHVIVKDVRAVGSNGTSDNSKATFFADLDLASEDDEEEQQLQQQPVTVKPIMTADLDLASEDEGQGEVKQEQEPSSLDNKKHGEKQLSQRHNEHHSDYDNLLVVDAATTGNVARYINHSCDGGNLVVQPVLTGRCKNVFFYYISLFSSRDIPKGEELTYNYSEKYKGITCQCGAPGCRGVMTGK